MIEGIKVFIHPVKDIAQAKARICRICERPIVGVAGSNPAPPTIAVSRLRGEDPTQQCFQPGTPGQGGGQSGFGSWAAVRIPRCRTLVTTTSSYAPARPPQRPRRMSAWNPGVTPAWPTPRRP